IDPRTDIYSIGITLFEALTARKPFAREEDTPMAYVEVIQEILTKPLPDPRAFYPAISPDVVRLLNKATAKDPADRFQSCAEFLGALEIVDSSVAVPPIASPSAASSPTVVVPRTAAAAGARVSEPTVARSAGPAPTGTTGAARPVIRQEPPKRSAMPWILLALVVLSVGGYFGYQEYLKRNSSPVTHLTDADAMRISRSVAADTKQYQMSGNAGALASLFDEKNVEFFKLKRATRDQIRTDIAKLTSTIASTEQFDITVKRARALDDSTIESEWVIAYQRTKNDGSILRGSTSNLTRLHLTDGQWLITSQRENWTQRNNVPPPPKPKADSIAAADSVKHPQTPSADDDRDAKFDVVRAFITGVTGGDALATWNRMTTGALKTSDEQSRFLSNFSGKGFDLLDVSTSGDAIIARLAHEEGKGIQNIVRVQCRLVNEGGGYKITELRINP
ncbi:MAG: hypothetical protein ABIR47_03780, partial [Candidatus Kapaibacterium sp.]